MDIPGKIKLYCPLVDAKGTPADLVAIGEGYYQISLSLKGSRHTILVPVAQSAVVFSEPEPDFDQEIEIER